MNTAPRTLEALFDQVRALDEQQQAWIAERLEEQLAEAKGESNHEDALKDLDYRAYVENALAEAEQDRLAGRVHSAEEVFNALEESIKAKYDALRG
jgi:hypothetical protein